MRAIISILTFLFSATLLCGQTTEKQVKTDTMIYGSRKCKDCPLVTDTVIYQLLKCGLYVGSNGDLGYRTEEIYNDNFDMRTRYITWIWGADKGDTINGGDKEMKFVIDTSSFRFLSDLYWADKNNIYGFNPMSDGGTVYLSDIADRKTFVVLGGAGYAKDKTNVYYRGSVIEGADLKTFRDIKYKGISELACDKLYFYQIGQRMTDEEIKEFGLEQFNGDRTEELKPSDFKAIYQLAFDLPELQQYYHTDTDTTRKQIVIQYFGEADHNNLKGVIKFDRQVLILSEDEIKRRNLKSYFVLGDWVCGLNSVRLQLSYAVEGLTASYMFKKVNDKWTIVSHNLAER